MNQVAGGKRSLVALMFALAFLGGCAKDRPLRPVIPNTSRVAKSDLAGTYLYLRTVTDVQSPGPRYEWMAPGMYMDADRLVQFSFKENAVEIVALDPQFQHEREAKTNTVLASFSARHVDVLRKQNADLQDTNEEEETDTRRVWQEREKIVIDTTKDAVDGFNADAIVTSNVTGIEIDRASGAINFSVLKRMKDDTVVTVRYSFLKYNQSQSYQAKEYPRELQRRFGFFKTTTLDFDKYGRVTTDTRKEIANRWDTTKPVTYYLSKNYPEHLKATTKAIFAGWNAAFKEAVGHDVLTVKDNSGQELGDLRYSLITYDASEAPLHRILGYGPSYTNPRTGEILKADVILYGGSLKRSVYSERIWENLLTQAPTDGLEDLLRQLLPGGHPAAPGGAPKHTSDLSQSMSTFVGKREGRIAQGEVVETSRPDTTARLNNDILTQMKDFTPEKAIPEIKQEYLKDHSKRITRVNEDVMKLLADAKAGKDGKELTDEELEIQIFTPLLAHELGHTLGLRHNFEGSADEKHYGAYKTASVMDYGFLSSQEPQGVGQYDAAAIQVLYGSDQAKLDAALAENFFYCTDENIMDSRNALCNQFDAGSTLSKAIENQVLRYNASFVFNNIRGDRVFFGQSRDYMSRVARYLIPIRLAFDNAQAILTAAKGTSPVAFWYVAGQRVEADKDTKAGDRLKIQVPEGFEVKVTPGQWGARPKLVDRWLDKSKIQKIVADAEETKGIAFESFLQIILDEDRPMYSSGDLVHGELQIRGTIYDKILALMFLYSRTPDPSGNGAVITMFHDLEDGSAAGFLSYLLSNTAPVVNPTTRQVSSRLMPYDVNLRQVALGLLWNELAVPGSSAGSRDMYASQKVNIDVTAMARKAQLAKALTAAPALRELLAKTKEAVTGQMLQKELVGVGLAAFNVAPLNIVPALLQIPDALQLAQINQVLDGIGKAEDELKQLQASTTREQGTVENIDTYRAQIRTRLKQLLAGGLDQPAQAKLSAEIAQIETQRNRINAAYVNTVGDVFIKAPVTLPMQSFSTATGRLIRDNVNRKEDLRLAALELAQAIVERIQQERAKPDAQQNKPLIRQLAQVGQSLAGRATAIEEYLSSERLVVENMYQLYNGGNP